MEFYSLLFSRITELQLRQTARSKEKSFHSSGKFAVSTFQSTKVQVFILHLDSIFRCLCLRLFGVQAVHVEPRWADCNHPLVRNFHGSNFCSPLLYGRLEVPLISFLSFEENCLELIRILKSAAWISKSTASLAIQQLLTVMAGTTKVTTQ